MSRWIDGIDALAYALGIERELNQELLILHEVAKTAEDPHVRLFLNRCTDSKLMGIYCSDQVGLQC